MKIINNLMPSCMKLLVSKVVGLFSVLFFGSCVDNSPFFGNDLVPPGQEMVTLIDSSINFKTYNIKLDSVGTSRYWAAMYLGQLNSALTGRTYSQFYTNYGFKPFTGDGENLWRVNFGTTPRADSMFMRLEVKYRSGDSTKASEIEIYKIKDFDFIYDSVYYSNFKIEKYLEAEPFLKIQVTGTKSHKVRMPQDFMMEHFDTRTTDDNIYSDIEKFHKKFKGWYFVTKPVSGDVGAFYDVDMASSYMSLYYNNKNFAESPDTVLIQNYFFRGEYASKAIQFQMYQHDFSKSDISVGGINAATINDTLETSVGQQIAYTSGMAGLGAMVEFSKADIEKFIAKCNERTGSKAAIGVHRAQIVWKKLSKVHSELPAFDALGLYYNYSKDKFIPDYDPITARYNAQSQGNSFVNTYGLLNLSKDEYTTDVTQYIQKVVKGDQVRLRLQLYPEWDQVANPDQGVVWSTAHATHRPYLVITYTLVK